MDLAQLKKKGGVIADALRRHGSLARAAEALAVAKTTLHDKIRKYGLHGD